MTTARVPVKGTGPARTLAVRALAEETGSFAKVAAILGISAERVRQIAYRAGMPDWQLPDYDDGDAATGKRRCTKCLRIKPLDAFSQWKQGVNGRLPRCRSCERDRRRAYDYANRGKVREPAGSAPCLCGCGLIPIEKGSVYRQGHDMRHRFALKKAAEQAS